MNKEGQVSQKFPVVLEIDLQARWDGEEILAVGDFLQDLFFDPLGEADHPAPVATGTKISSFTEEG